MWKRIAYQLARARCVTKKGHDKDRLLFRALPALDGPFERLACLPEARLRQWIDTDPFEDDWERAVQQVAATGNIPGLVQSAGMLDQRLLYHLVRGTGATSVLEVGTNLGCSAGHLALGVKHNLEQGTDGPGRLVTVDRNDVNHPKKKKWAKRGSPLSPADFIQQIGCGPIVTFVASYALPYLRRTQERFDLVFLDGSHAAHAVYREIPAAVARLNPGGVIVLHDHFPDGRPAGQDADGNLQHMGPFLATQRLMQEGRPLRVLPIGRQTDPPHGPWSSSLGLVVHAG